MINEYIPLNEGLRPVQLEGARHRRGTNQPGGMALVQQVRTHRSNHAQCRLYSLVILIDQSIEKKPILLLTRVVGQDQCSIADTYWQTETGGHIITPLPGATPTKPGNTPSKKGNRPTKNWLYAH